MSKAAKAILPVALVLGALALAAGLWTGSDGETDGSAVRPTDRDAVADGSVITSDEGLDGGRLWFVWEGAITRIYQPRPFDLEEASAAGLEVAEPITRPLEVADAVTGAYFAVVPSAGADRGLYLQLRGRLHRITVTAVDEATLTEFPEARRGRLLDRITAPRSP